ncbi:MAG: hypothetical protein Q7S33_04105 [Nanoarchaeota archaeon]|nr:hypothetical protein [Nanoarchaeota archaeon]
MFGEVISGLINNPVYLLIAIIALMIILIGSLYLIERKVKKEVKTIKKSEELFYINQLKALGKAKRGYAEKLNYINKISKRIFNEAFNLDEKLSYVELRDEFSKRKERKISIFCELMVETIYSDKEISDEKIRAIILRLIEILETINKKKKLSEQLNKIAELKPVNKTKTIEEELKDIENESKTQEEAEKNKEVVEQESRSAEELFEDLDEYKPELNPEPIKPLLEKENFEEEEEEAIPEITHFKKQVLQPRLNLHLPRELKLEFPSYSSEIPEQKEEKEILSKLQKIEKIEKRPINEINKIIDEIKKSKENKVSTTYITDKQYDSGKKSFYDLKNKVIEMKNSLKKDEESRSKTKKEFSKSNENMEKIKSKFSNVKLNISEE